ncbi:MAG: response regulator [Ignavibacteria bacterium]|nr:response regulator [Ignavibacteria bacterium]
MKTETRILLLEDTDSDAALIKRELSNSELHPSFLHTKTREHFRQALNEFSPHVVLADYELPQFSAIDALRCVRESSPETPVIVVSGRISQDVASACFREGAAGYVIKENLVWLVPAVMNALRTKEHLKEQKQARAILEEREAAIRDSEQRYRMLFEKNPHPMWVFDLQTLRFLAVNEKAIAYYGYTEEEFLSMSIADIRPPEEVPRLLQELAGRETDTKHWGVWKHRKKDGTLIDVEIESDLIEWRGKAARLILANDVTEKRRNERVQQAIYEISEATESSRSLAELYGRVHRVIDSAINARNFYIALCDATTATKEFPYLVDELEGTEPIPKEPLGRGLTEYVFNAERSLLCSRGQYEGLLATKKIKQIGPPPLIWLGVPLVAEKKAIGVMAVQDYVNPKAYDEKDQLFLEYVSTQIAKAIDRKRAEEKIREQAELINQAGDGISVRSLDGTLLFMNLAGLDMIGYKAEEIIGTRGEIFYPEGYESIRKALELVLEHGFWEGEMSARRKDGVAILVESRWTLLRDAEGVPKSILKIFNDVTERKSLEAQFFRSQRLESIGTLASGIAHDLNNVLAPILLGVQMMQQHGAPEHLLRYIRTIDTSARRGASVVKQVLSFAAGVKGERVQLLPRTLVREMASLIEETFPKNIRLVRSVAPDAWPIAGDHTHLHQVLMNLCVNARDAMPLGGTLTLRVENIELDENYARMRAEGEPGKYVVFEVEDSGVGMPPEVLDKIFEPFFTTKEQGRGSGLGLSTARSLVKSHHGFINVYSEPDRGTSFKVYLPACPSDLEIPLAAAASPLPAGSGETILVVDDEQLIREITRDTLEAYGYRVITASDGTEAVACYAQNVDAVALVLTDIMMPYMDGYSTIKALQRIKPEVKIIATSGFAAVDKIGDYSRLGICAFLQKPFSTEKLLGMIHDNIKKT